jgi:8-oxo-dGTP diphosphatase
LRLTDISHKSINKNFRAKKKMEKNPTMLFVTAAALINENGAILLQKRPEVKAMAGLWEFPGGKVERGEAPAAALVRELKEELGVDVEAKNLMPCTFASEALGQRDLLLLLYICRIWRGEPKALESPEIIWVKPDEMHEFPMPPADAPFITVLKNLD